MTLNTEPVAITGAVVVLVNSIVALLVLLEVFDADVGAAVSLVVTNLVAVLGVLFARSKVTPESHLVALPPVGPNG